jgi:hypothetical protein
VKYFYSISRQVVCGLLFLPIFSLFAAPPALLSDEQAARLEDMFLREQYRERERLRREREGGKPTHKDETEADEPVRAPGAAPYSPPQPKPKPPAASRPLPEALGIILGDPEIRGILPPEIIADLESKEFQDGLRAGNKRDIEWFNDLVTQINRALSAPRPGQGGHGHGPQRPPQQQMPPAAQQAMGYMQHPQVQQKLASDPKALKPIMEGVEKALRRPDPRSKPRGFWGRLDALRQKLSPTGLTQSFNEKLGMFILRGWNKFGKMIRRALVAIIGKKNIYELDGKGEIKRNPQTGDPLPKMVMRTRNILDLDRTLSPEGMMGAGMTAFAGFQAVQQGKMPKATYQERGPNRWYEMLHNRHNLLRAIIEAGMMRVNRTLLHSVERLFIRPLLMNHLHIPEWKVSYAHYLLYMHTKINHTENLLSATGLAEKMRPLIEHPQNFVQHRLPFDLEEVRQLYRKSEAGKVEAMAKLEKGIRTFMHKVYQPLIAQIQSVSQPGKLTAMSDDRWTHELKELGLEFADGMRDNQSFTAHAILGIARQTNKRLKITDLIGKSDDSLTGSPASQFESDMADIERVVNAIHARPANSTTPVTFRGTALSPVMERKVVWATERVIDMFRDFILPPLQGQSGLLSYPQYMRRLIMPQLAMKFMPNSLKEKLGFNGQHGMQKAAQQFHVIEEFFDATFHGLDAIIDLIALVKEFRNTTSFRGKYYQFGTTLNTCLVKVSMALSSLGVSGDPDLMEHGMKYLLGRFVHKKLGSPFTPFEEQRIANALLEARINDPNTVRRLHKLGTVDEVIREIKRIRKEKNRHHNALFGDRGDITTAFEALRERWGSKLMGVHSGLTMIINLYRKFGIGEILMELDEGKQTFSEVGAEELAKIFARKSIAHMVATGVQTVLGRLFKPLTEGITGMGATLMGSHNYHMLTGKFHNTTGGVFAGGIKPIYSFTKHLTEGTMKHGISKLGKAVEDAGSRTMKDMGMDRLMDKMKGSAMGQMMGSDGDINPAAMMQAMGGMMGGGM